MIHETAGEGMVFVLRGAKGEWKWTQMTPEVAAERGLQGRIIKCTYCKGAASQLDHLWPHHKELTACKKCASKKPWIEAGEDVGITP